MAILYLVFFILLKCSTGLKYEVTRSAYVPDKIVFKTNRRNICATYRATNYGRIDKKVTCTCPPGTTFHSINTEVPACLSSTAVHLGCNCFGKNCASSITPILIMLRKLRSKKTWCNNETTPRYTINVWTPTGWKKFSRSDDMVVRFYVKNDIGNLKFQWKVDGFNVISHYSGNLFLITVSCNGGNTKHCFLAKSPGTKMYNIMQATPETVEHTPEYVPKQSTNVEVGLKFSTLILIGVIVGVLILIVNLAILVIYIFRKVSSHEAIQEIGSKQIVSTITGQGFHSC